MATATLSGEGKDVIGVTFVVELINSKCWSRLNGLFTASLPLPLQCAPTMAMSRAGFAYDGLFADAEGKLMQDPDFLGELGL